VEVTRRKCVTYGKDSGHRRDVKTEKASANTCEGPYKVLEATLSGRRGISWSYIPGSSQSLSNTTKFSQYCRPSTRLQVHQPSASQLMGVWAASRNHLRHRVLNNGKAVQRLSNSAVSSGVLPVMRGRSREVEAGRLNGSHRDNGTVTYWMYLRKG
jgi:hypothetical protein